MKVYLTNSGGRYGERAYVTPIEKTVDGFMCLCLYSDYASDNWYLQEGKVTELCDYELVETNYQASDFPISETFLFRKFAESFVPPQDSPKCKYCLHSAGKDYALISFRGVFY